MQYLLSWASRSLLKHLAQQQTLCAFDFDGTLSPIADHPDQASMRDCTRHTVSSCEISNFRCRVPLRKIALRRVKE
jgi:hypothetical protein